MNKMRQSNNRFVLQRGIVKEEILIYRKLNLNITLLALFGEYYQKVLGQKVPRCCIEPAQANRNI
jgi:hypothetical protein